jgi:hypothetical protein
VLALLWAASALLYAPAGIGYVAWSGLRGGYGTGIVVASVVMSLLATLMAFGLWWRAPWARILQIVVAAIGLFDCPFLIATAAILAYMLRGDIKLQFSGRSDFRQLSADEADVVRRGSPEGLFTAAILGGVVIGALAAAVVLFFVLRQTSVGPPVGGTVTQF